MPVSSRVFQNIQFLNDLDPGHFSIGLKNNQIAKVEKRSPLRNFFGWVIYLITFTLVPRNGVLDQLTRDILNAIQNDMGNVTTDEKVLAEKAVRNLQAVIQQNGGSEAAAVENLLKTIAKIHALPAVQKVYGNLQIVEEDPVLDNQENTSIHDKSQDSPENREGAPVTDPNQAKEPHVHKIEQSKTSEIDPEPTVDDTKLQKAPSALQLDALAQALSDDKLYKLIEQDPSIDNKKDFYAILLSLCPFDVQVEFVSKVLASHSYEHRKCLEIAKLPLTVWEKRARNSSYLLTNSAIV